MSYSPSTRQHKIVVFIFLSFCLSLPDNDETEDQGETQNLLVEGLKDKIKESRRKLDLQESAIEDLNEKMDEIKENTRQRQEEIAELKEMIVRRHQFTGEVSTLCVFVDK